MKRILLISLLLGGCLFGCGTGTSSEPSKVDKYFAAVDEMNRAIEDMASRHRAVIDWDKKLSFEPPFSIDYQQAFLRTDGRPLLVKIKVEDVELVHGRYGITASIPDSYSDFPVELHLECPPDIANRILAAQNGYERERWAVVVHITSVRRRDCGYREFTINIYSEGDNDFSFDFTAGALFEATGNVIDAMPRPL